jgi:alpha/beta superfamily hydrolase
MHNRFSRALGVLLVAAVPLASAQRTEEVVEIQTRPGVTQRFIYLSADEPKASVILFAGGNGALRLGLDGNIKSGRNNFLVRSRPLFVENGLAVAVVDAPSDRQSAPFLGDFRQTPEHVADIKAVIAWLRQKHQLPVWLVGTSRGTQSAAFIATQLPLSEGGPDGLVLTSSILADHKSRSVSEIAVQQLAIPVLVVHHEQDGCKICPPYEVPRLMHKLSAAPRKEQMLFKGGDDVGDPCEAMAHHGFNGIEREVVGKIAAWIQSK